MNRVCIGQISTLFRTPASSSVDGIVGVLLRCSNFTVWMFIVADVRFGCAQFGSVGTVNKGQRDIAQIQRQFRFCLSLGMSASACACFTTCVVNIV